MQSVQKKQRGSHKPWLWLILIWAALTLVIAARVIVLDLPRKQAPDIENETIDLVSRDTGDVQSITIQRGSDPVWTAVQEEAGLLTVQGEGGFTLMASDSASLLTAAARITAEETLTEDPADYAAALADFGLAEPRYVASITYADGTSVTVSVGNASADGTWRYMLLSGRDGLYAFSRGSVEALFPNRDTLYQVTQPTLHKARIDRITLTGPSGIQAEWTLQCPITAADAIDRWAITAPLVYPADAEAMTNLLANVANLRLGAYVCEATPEALTQYGFDAPRLTIDVHMAAGTIGTVSAEGVYETADWPAGTTTYVIGGEKNDMVDYVLHDGTIYISSHFTIGIFLDYDVKATMSRYLAPTALGNLASLTIETDGAVETYAITRTEQVAENNELLTDVDGSILYDVSLTKNGEPADYAAFEAAYNALLTVTVSGTLPNPVDAAPHTVWTFTDVDGTVHTVAFATFDAMHDAVSIDGHQAFYLIKGGFDLGL